MFIIYDLLSIIANLVLLIPQYLKRPAALRKKWVREKTGNLSESADGIWVHAVSVGEVNAALPLLKRLRSDYPERPLFLSTITDTGQTLAMDKSPEGTHVVYLPFDIRFILSRWFKRVRPGIFITVETELWPNIFRVLADNNVPVIVLNGRISERSLKGYMKLSFFMKKVFECVSVFGMQSRLDAERLKMIGAEDNKIVMTGNFKFEMNAPDKRPQWLGGIKGRVIVAGSTHSGEEKLILAAYQKALADFSDLTLILAPRHPERFREAEEIIRASGIRFRKRTEFSSDTSPLGFSGGVILLDSIGELSSVYSVADIAIIGKSFTGYGGQNPLEPAYWGRPILCGLHMENFPFIKEFYQEKAAFEVDPLSLPKKIKELLLAPEEAAKAGAMAKEIYNRNSGAVDRAMLIVRECLNK